MLMRHMEKGRLHFTGAIDTNHGERAPKRYSGMKLTGATPPSSNPSPKTCGSLTSLEKWRLPHSFREIASMVSGIIWLSADNRLPIHV